MAKAAAAAAAIPDSLDSITEIRDLARELDDKIREVNRQEKGQHDEAGSYVNAHLDLARIASREVLSRLDLALDSL